MSRALSLVVSAVVLVAGVRAAEAKCARQEARIEVWPSGSLAPSGFIGISIEGGQGRQGFAQAEAALQSGELTLEAVGGGEAVPLERVSYGRGIGVTQVLLRPIWALQLGETYSLRLGDQALMWLVQRSPGLAAPGWVGAAHVTGWSYFGGCPGQSLMTVRVPITDGQGVLRMLVVATSLQSGKETELVVPIRDHAIEIGHRGCGSGFDLVPMEDYSFELSVLDEAGHLVATPMPLVARAPGEVDTGREPPPPMPRLEATERSDRSWLRAGWPYGLGLVGLAFAIGSTFLCVRFILRSDR